MHNHLELYLDGKNHAFEFDLDMGNAPYYTGKDYDAEFARHEVPY
jgi:hypothetical protein